LSQYAVTSQQHSRELTELERFSRHLLAAPADASTLPNILTSHFPRMFEYYHAEIRLTDGQILLHLPLDHPLLSAEMWHWFLVEQQARPHFITEGNIMPWTNESSPHTIIMLPILSNQTREPLGGICLLLESSWFIDVSSNTRPVLQNLADQIASALHSAELYAQSLIHEKMAQELVFAGQIQTSFLPASLPHITGWQLAAMLRPARETSGDFYDVLLLSNGHVGLIMADVADKGLGAALFMAMSRTLLRTYAFVYPDRPDLVLHYANQRILTDSHTKLFVTVFYGVLNPDNGELIFANAGHVPPYVIRANPPHETFALRNTGMPLGVFETATWQMQAIKIEAGDSLVLYTDGLTEASNPTDQFFGASRLLEVARAASQQSAEILQEHILIAATEFTDGYPQNDDLTLMVLKHAA
jgi:serine phosphatase RsbU (regulator of sigma subunit)